MFGLADQEYCKLVKKTKDCWQTDTVLVLHLCANLHARFWTDVFYLLPNVISGAWWTDGTGSPCHYHAAEAPRYKDLVVPQYWWLTRRINKKEWDRCTRLFSNPPHSLFYPPSPSSSVLAASVFNTENRWRACVCCGITAFSLSVISEASVSLPQNSSTRNKTSYYQRGCRTSN